MVPRVQAITGMAIHSTQCHTPVVSAPPTSSATPARLHGASRSIPTREAASSPVRNSPKWTHTTSR